MVCASCEKKLNKIAAPDKWKDGAQNTLSSGKVRVGQNKLLANRAKFKPYEKQLKCQTCKKSLHQDALYCTACAFVKGCCPMCGKITNDTKSHKNVDV